MLAKWIDSSLIFLLTLLGITISYFQTNRIHVYLFNLIFFLTMLLILFQGIQEGHRNLYRIKTYYFLFLVIVAITSNILYQLSIFPDLNLIFLLIETAIKVGFYGYGWLAIARILMQKQEITGQTILLAITGYLFIGVIWSFIYYAIWQIEPRAFHIAISEHQELQTWNLAVYFSLTTLTTVGYGDIVPVGRLVMLAANFEAMVGTIYLTVIIARLVSLYSISE